MKCVLKVVVQLKWNVLSSKNARGIMKTVAQRMLNLNLSRMTCLVALVKETCPTYEKLEYHFI